MSRHVLPHVWTPHRNPAYEHIAGAKPVCLVRVRPLPQGFLWQHGKQSGFCPSVELAREYAETAREIWPRLLR